ncbi:hypothetical protein L6164_017060 [Bauhinia variegata]|uniref:Uncharacterized protein n=1 Tax=Bauhinia variegata TaxID=167791 RepID=A0ACB9N807_BAUVA|nr:hypothetical protein L6164_017060 [Bauhinia variegata]
MDCSGSGISSPHRPKWRKVAYGGMQPGFADNHADESFLEQMVMNASVVKRDMLKFDDHDLRFCLHAASLALCASS